MQFWGVLALLVLAGCAIQPSKPKVLQGEVLTFLEKQPGESQQVVRYLVTSEYLRMDVSGETGVYRLFDRQRQQLYVVNGNKQEVLVGPAGIAALADIELPWQQTQEDSQAIPRDNQTQEGSGAVYYRLDLAGKACLELVAVDGLLPEGQLALQEYRAYQADMRQSRGPSSSLTSAQQACYQAVFVQQPQQAFAFGFPLREWSVSGHQRFLQDAKTDIKFEKQLFDVPKKYSYKKLLSVP